MANLRKSSTIKNTLEQFYGITSNTACMELLNEFIYAPRFELQGSPSMPSVSLFSGAGLSDLGYEQAGFRFVVQAELDEHRSTLCKKNFPHSAVIQGNIVKTYKQVINQYRESDSGRLHLLTVTPPCQGMSSSNPGRGKISKAKTRDKRNRLILNSIPVIQALQPRVVVVENVRQILSEQLIDDEQQRSVIEFFRSALSRNYVLYTGVIQVADYGIPQMRTRAIVVAIHTDEPSYQMFKALNKLPWPRVSHLENSGEEVLPWISIEEWFSFQQYPPLDSLTPENAKYDDDWLHQVPSYEKEPDRYRWVADIPPHSGKNAYQNSSCPNCSSSGIPEGLMYCPNCNEPLLNRPYVQEDDGTYRLIKGFHSSYRRMASNKPAPTVMTNSSHLGSDYNIHPWENRVLSIRECAELQTIPRSYCWQWAQETGHAYVSRQVIGEALPPWFTYLHGLVLRKILSNSVDPALLESSSS